MSYLGVILQRHEDKPYFNTKVLQDAARFDSLQAARNLMTSGWDSYEKLRDLIRRLPEPVAHDILNDLTAETAFRTAPRADACHQPPLPKCVKVVEDWAHATQLMIAALSDGVVTEAEDAQIEPVINRVVTSIEQVRSTKNAKRSMRMRTA